MTVTSKLSHYSIKLNPNEYIFIVCIFQSNDTWKQNCAIYVGTFGIPSPYQSKSITRIYNDLILSYFVAVVALVLFSGTKRKKKGKRKGKSPLF